jgi:hypothetical protein
MRRGDDFLELGAKVRVLKSLAYSFLQAIGVDRCVIVLREDLHRRGGRIHDEQTTAAQSDKGQGTGAVRHYDDGSIVGPPRELPGDTVRRHPIDEIERSVEHERVGGVIRGDSVQEFAILVCQEMYESAPS